MTQKTEPAQQQANDNDMVLVERSLIGAACNAIDKKRDAPRLLGELREIAFRAPSFSKPPGNAIDGLLATARPFLAEELLLKQGYTWSGSNWVAPSAPAYSAPFSTDVPQCCESPATCPEPCDPPAALVQDELPSSCRERLRLEGKPYPRSGCLVCKTGGLMGCPYKRRMAAP